MSATCVCVAGGMKLAPELKCFEAVRWFVIGVHTPSLRAAADVFCVRNMSGDLWLSLLDAILQDDA